MPPKKQPARKRKRLTLKKTKPKAKDANENGEHDRTIYEVEKIVDSKLEGRQLYYKVKWLNWPIADNSFEPDTRLNCEYILLKYVINNIDGETYVKSVEELLVDLDNGKQVHFTRILDPFAIIGYMTLQSGVTKFVQMDSFFAKVRYLKYVYHSNQQYTLYALHLPTYDEVNKYHEKYSRQLTLRFQAFQETPLVHVMFPLKIETVFYPPPPLFNLLFEPVTQKMYEARSQNPHMFPPKSEELGFCNSKPFIRDDYFEKATKYHDPKLQNVSQLHRSLVKRMKRIEYEEKPRFGVNLQLRQEETSGWVLYSADNVDVHTPLMMMTGIISPKTVAHECLQKYGEAVAFSSFINIPGSGMCLDRRQFYDFSKFIPHSCKPTCSVRLVFSGNEVPDLVVYSIEPLSSSNKRAITLDYYKGFTNDVKKYFENKGEPVDACSLIEDEIDFVQCRCGAQGCRSVLYIDRSLKKADKKATKQEKMEKLDPLFKFYGCEVISSLRIYEIKDYTFKQP